ncbi:hypothetical protein, partial [Actinomadura nitritigenes]|uniref:hypothetical protein n=1 Tax=Actinomadura nitritigenes TaxID=134602 RepID=UPI0031CEF851
MHRSKDGVSDQAITGGGDGPASGGGPATRPATGAGTGADFLQLDAAEAPPGGMAEWLARRLREAAGIGRESVVALFLPR